MAAAFVLMGLWAVFANRTHPMPAPLMAGLVQGTLSALITLGLKRMIEAMAARLPGHLAVVLPVIGTFALSLTLLAAMHRLMGTPEILRTIAVPLTVSTGYAALYSLSLRRAAHG